MVGWCGSDVVMVWMGDGESILAGQLICMSNSSRAICGLHTIPVDLGWVLLRWGGCDKCEPGKGGRSHCSCTHVAACLPEGAGQPCKEAYVQEGERGGREWQGRVALSQWLWHFRPIVPTSGTSLLEAQVQAPQMRQVNAPVTPTEVGGGKYFWGS